MSWERARTEEQKKSRTRAILDAARALIHEKSFHAITLSDIAKRVSFTRANLYKYFESKEEVYLALLADCIVESGRNARASLPTQAELERQDRAQAFTTYWVRHTVTHPEMHLLLTMVGTILEQNCSDRVLLASKRAMKDATDRDFVFALMTFFPGREQAEYHGLLQHLLVLSNGLYPLCGLDPRQREMLQREGLCSMVVDFEPAYTALTRAVVTQWAGPICQSA